MKEPRTKKEKRADLVEKARKKKEQRKRTRLGWRGPKTSDSWTGPAKLDSGEEYGSCTKPDGEIGISFDTPTENPEVWVARGCPRRLPAPEPAPELELEPAPVPEDKLQKLNDAMFAAASEGDEEAVRRCLRDGVDPNAADGDGQTALLHADRIGRTALMFAAVKNQVGCMAVLGEAGADVDKADEYGLRH